MVSFGAEMNEKNMRDASHPSNISYLEPSSQELVLDFQEVAPVHLPFEWLVEDGEPHVVLDVLPAGVAVSEGSIGQENHRRSVETQLPLVKLQKKQSRKGYCMMPASSQ